MRVGSAAAAAKQVESVLSVVEFAGSKLKKTIPSQWKGLGLEAEAGVGLMQAKRGVIDC